MIRSLFPKKFLLAAILALCFQTHTQAYKTHHVVSGESMWGISNKYNITVEQLIAANPSLEKGLKADTYIRIPEPSDLKAMEEGSPEAEADKAPQSHIVRINRNNSYTPGARGGTENPASTQIPGNVPGSATVKPVTDKKPVPDAPKEPAYNTPNEPANNSHKEPAYNTPREIVYEAPGDVAGFMDPDARHDYTVDGYYTAMFGDTFSSISRKTDVHPDTLARLNPFIDGATIPEGTLVRISSRPIENVQGHDLSFVDSVEMRVLQKPVAVRQQPAATTGIVVVALPFETEATSLGKQSLMATEFYKGLLLAMQSRIASGEASPTKIVAVDTKGGIEKAMRQIGELGLDRTSIIIPADDDMLMTAIENSGCEAAVLNILSIRDNSYIDRGNMIQCNISQPLMYDKATGYITDRLGEYTPVILDPAGAAAEKAGFIEALRGKCADSGIEVVDLSFSGKLTDRDLAKLDKNRKYVFIPKSGNADVFEKFSEALSDYFAASQPYDRLKLFGYPDWVVMRGDNEKALHDMGALIYSRFYLDEQDIFTKDILDAYTKWYGAPMAKAFPMQAMLGYDAGNLILHTRGIPGVTSAVECFDSNSYEGEQSAFHFIHDHSKGLINNALYIIEYLPGETCIISVI